MDFRSAASQSSDNKLSNRSFENNQNTGNTVLVFLGSCVTFSDRLLRTVAFEFDDIEVLRLKTVADLHGLDEQTKNSVRLVLVDDATIGSLLHSAEGLEHETFGAGAVLAYRSLNNARQILRMSRKTGTDSKLRFLPMKTPLDGWLAALRLLILGEAFLPSELVEITGSSAMESSETQHIDSSSADQVVGDSAPPSLFHNLTSREVQVLELVASGLQNKSIAKKLGLSEHTVKLHIHHIFGKLGVRNRTSASTWFLSHQRTSE